MTMTKTTRLRAGARAKRSELFVFFWYFGTFGTVGIEPTLCITTSVLSCFPSPLTSFFVFVCLVQKCATMRRRSAATDYGVYTHKGLLTSREHGTCSKATAMAALEWVVYGCAAFTPYSVSPRRATTSLVFPTTTDSGTAPRCVRCGLPLTKPDSTARRPPLWIAADPAARAGIAAHSRNIYHHRAHEFCMRTTRAGCSAPLVSLLQVPRGQV